MRFLTVLLASLCLAGASLAATPQSATGSYRVTILLPESNGATDPSSEDWTPAMLAEVVDRVLSSCLYWAEAAPPWAELSCDVGFYDFRDTPTGYEPITHPSGAPLLGFWGGDEDLWINELMDVLGHSSVLLYYYFEVEDFNDAAAAAAGTQGAYSAFVVNSLNDTDGAFSDGSSAYAPVLNAPYLVMTWDNGRWRDLLGAESLRKVASHETGHLFGAEDEYASSASECGDTHHGYANENHEGCPGGAVTSCLMRADAPCGYLHPYPICYWTRGAVGWAPECAPTGICGQESPRSCASRRQCVDVTAFCDGSADCDDASDELGCERCPTDRYACADGTCEAAWPLCSCPDGDRDGHRDAECGGDDCDDHFGAVHPGAVEVCNARDDNCAGGIDEGFDQDMDGWSTCNGDCDDSSASVRPEAQETCGNGLDEDCDGDDARCEYEDGGQYADAEGIELDATGPDAAGARGDAGPARELVGGESADGCGCEVTGQGTSSIFVLGCLISVSLRPRTRRRPSYSPVILPNPHSASGSGTGTGTGTAFSGPRRQSRRSTTVRATREPPLDE
ncbi:MAG: hypothetical protein HY791_13120 [Deltaproteobacteria bacterium]|nr:hypothetical protein [Deltaproteobacteria bacterium]